LAISMLFAQPLCAELIIGSTAGPTYFAEDYSTFATTSADMVGMQVTVEFRNGSTDTRLWTANGITGDGWTMTHQSGSTFDSPFTLTNERGNRLIRFTMHGMNSSTIFDRSVAQSTAGTANGRDLQEYSDERFFQDIDVTYFDQVQTIGAPAPVGDIFAGMEVAFERGLRRNRSFVFRTDTDTTLNSISAVPEPTTSITFAIAILGFCVRRRRNGQVN
jgi:uncharacterized protein YfiM (DUF2279 family)